MRRTGLCASGSMIAHSASGSRSPIDRDWFKAAGYEVADAADLNALAARVAAAGYKVERFTAEDAARAVLKRVFAPAIPPETVWNSITAKAAPTKRSYRRWAFRTSSLAKWAWAMRYFPHRTFPLPWPSTAMCRLSRDRHARLSPDGARCPGHAFRLSACRQWAAPQYRLWRRSSPAIGGVHVMLQYPTLVDVGLAMTG
jgi:hypothetical protein